LRTCAYDLVQGFKNLFNAVGDEAIKNRAQEPVEIETDARYSQKYVGVWREKI
jgi:hypothetical protein